MDVELRRLDTNSVVVTLDEYEFKPDKPVEDNNKSQEADRDCSGAFEFPREPEIPNISHFIIRDGGKGRFQAHEGIMYSRFRRYPDGIESLVDFLGLSRLSWILTVRFLELLETVSSPSVSPGSLEPLHPSYRRELWVYR